MVQAAPPDEVWLFKDPNATITVLVPPRTHLNGILYAFDQQALKASEIWDIVSLHVIPDLITSSDLLNGQGRLIPTLNADGQQLRLSLSLSDTSGRGPNSNAPAGTVGITDADMDACAAGSTMHAIGSMLFPDDFLLPPEGQPRDLNARDGGDSGGLSTGAMIGIGLALIACFSSCALGAVCYRRKVRKEQEALNAAEGSDLKPGKEGAGGVVETVGQPLSAEVSVAQTLGMMSASTHERRSDSGTAEAQQGSDGGHAHGVSSTPSRGTAVRTSDGIGLTTFGFTTGAVREAPGATADDDELKVWVEYQLDSLGEMPLLQRFVLLGAAERRAGGAGPSSLLGFLRSTHAALPLHCFHSIGRSPANRVCTFGLFLLATRSFVLEHFGLLAALCEHSRPRTNGGAVHREDAASSSAFGSVSNERFRSAPTGIGDLQPWSSESAAVGGWAACVALLTGQRDHAARCAGQAIVQFARSVRDRGQYALKFFLSRSGFEAERSFYTDSPLGKLLPRLEAMVDNADGSVQDAKGHPLPPFVIMERGESLDEWSRRRKPDMWAAMPVRPTLPAPDSCDPTVMLSRPNIPAFRSRPCLARLVPHVLTLSERFWMLSGLRCCAVLPL